MKKEKKTLQNFLFGNSEVETLERLKKETGFSKTTLLKMGLKLLANSKNKLLIN